MNVPVIAVRRRFLKRRNAGTQTRSIRRRVAGRLPRPPYSYIGQMPASFADQPLRKIAKLRYVCHLSQAGPGAAAIISTQFRANGMYDPEVAVGGHQPYGFDQLMAQYFHYTVVAANCTVETLQQETYVNVVSFVGYHNESGVPAAAFAAGGVNGLREMPMLSKDLMPITIGHYKENARSTSLSVDIAKMHGKTRAQLIGDANFQGTDAADPTEDCYFSLNTYSPNLTDESGHTLLFKVTLTYLAVFTEPRWYTTS